VISKHSTTGHCTAQHDKKLSATKRDVCRLVMRDVQICADATSGATRHGMAWRVSVLIACWRACLAAAASIVFLSRLGGENFSFLDFFSFLSFLSFFSFFACKREKAPGRRARPRQMADDSGVDKEI
jgi:hypothetical protein